MAARAFARVAPGASEALARRDGRARDGSVGSARQRAAPRKARSSRTRALLQHGQTVESFAKRGAILDRNGGVLVRSLPSESIYAVPTEVTDPHAVAVKLAPLLRKPAAAIELALRDKSDFRWLARKVPHDVAERVDALQIAGIYRKGEETGIALRRVGPARVHRRRLHRHGRERAGRPGVLARQAAARNAGQDAHRSGPVRPRDPVRRDARDRARGRGQDDRHDARPVLAVRGRAPAARGGEEVERAQRDRAGDGPVDGRAARGRQRPRLRPRAFRRVDSRTRGATARSATRTSPARRSSSSPPRPRSRAANFRRACASRRATRCKSAGAPSTTPRTA